MSLSRPRLVYIGLGSNVGDRKQYLEKAILSLSKVSEKPTRPSPVYESSALLPPAAPTEWDKSYLNMVAEIHTSLAPEELLKKLQAIEDENGRVHEARWSPRTLDLDILHYEGVRQNDPHLILPHPETSKRNFVLTPLRDLNPTLKITDADSVLRQNRQLPTHLPSLMAIVNVTPDSFSDGGSYQTEEQFQIYLDEVENDVHYLDLG
ncbi:MAG: 2-amino-4-hydroxy-6-hydroxymethyldihydropteridine diphosphokinase, partial [Pseudobdellovibrionaceae bacterium]